LVACGTSIGDGGELELELVNGSMRRKKKEAGRGREGKYPGRRLRDKDEDGQRREWPARGHDARTPRYVRRGQGCYNPTPLKKSRPKILKEDTEVKYSC